MYKILDIDSVSIYEPIIIEGNANNCKPFYMGLKTNMLYDAAALPNLRAEF